MNKLELINYLNEYLQIDKFKDIDDSQNGLQVDNSKSEIQKIGYSVDATGYIFDMAIEQGVDFLITHHGLFWGISQTITDMHYAKVSKLIQNDISLYTAHLPLDAHPEVGNNIGLAKGFINVFGLQDYKLEHFNEYKGQYIDYGIKFDTQIHINSIIEPYCKQMQLEKKLYNFGNKIWINSVCISSGGAGFLASEAQRLGYDLFITGEFSRGKLAAARDLQQTVLAGGHRETEKIGVKLLAHHLQQKFGIQTIFLDKKF